MNDRERFNATMHYQPCDRAPIMDFGFWDETIVLWHDQSLPRHVDCSNSDDFLGMDCGLDRASAAVGVSVGLVPPFEEKVLEDRGDLVVIKRLLAVFALDNILHADLDAVPTGVLSVAGLRAAGEEVSQEVYAPRRLHVLFRDGASDG